MAFDATSLYPSAMYDENSVFILKLKQVMLLHHDMNDKLVEEFNNQTFKEASAILKIKYYNPHDIILQHLPIKEEVNAKQDKHEFLLTKIEVNSLRNGYSYRYFNICGYSRNC